MLFHDMAKIRLLQNYATDKARMLTNKPVFLTTEPLGDNTAACIRQIHIAGSVDVQDAFEITIDSNYYESSDTIKLKHIISHELAHIPYPRSDDTEHPPKFQNLARHLGAGIYVKNGVG